MANLLLLAVGMALLLAGGNALVRGASALAAGAGISPLIIGLTVVAFGTSTPELAVNVTASLQGSSDIAFGNIIGSNIANIGLIIGLAALLKPLEIESQIIFREIPMLLLASMSGIVLGSDALLRGQAGMFDRGDGLMLLLLFAVFMYYTLAEVFRKRGDDSLLREAAESLPAAAPQSYAAQAGLILAGLVGLVIGGGLTVDAASSLALSAGISPAVVGLTVVAVGTSLPELVTSLIATWKGQTDIAVGNVVGSNIFNLLFIAGLSATAYPIALPASGVADLLVMAGFAFVLLPLSVTHQRRIVRGEGLLLLLLYIGYTAWRALSPAG